MSTPTMSRDTELRALAQKWRDEAWINVACDDVSKLHADELEALITRTEAGACTNCGKPLRNDAAPIHACACARLVMNAAPVANGAVDPEVVRLRQLFAASQEQVRILSGMLERNQAHHERMMKLTRTEADEAATAGAVYQARPARTSLWCNVSEKDWHECVGKLWERRILYTRPQRAEDAVWSASDAEVEAWVERHDLAHALRGNDARCAFEDARSAHMLAALPSPPKGAT